MVVKIVLVFLVLMAALAVFGRLRFPGGRQATGKCQSCGRPRIGRARCPCGKGRA